MPKRIPLEGEIFGRLSVKEYIGKGKYKCICGCGKECEIFGANLVRGHTTSCGCKKASCDLSDKVFGSLKVVKRAEGKSRGGKKRALWECECLRCGNIISVYADSLKSGSTTSCGCLQRERDIPEKLKKEYIAGTQISKIQSEPTKSNKTGVVGVNWDKSRGKWQASIRFKGHKYNIGRFDDFEMAVKARKEAERKIFGDMPQFKEPKGKI